MGIDVPLLPVEEVPDVVVPLLAVGAVVAGLVVVPFEVLVPEPPDEFLPVFSTFTVGLCPCAV